MGTDYCTRDDVEDVGGIDNVAKWADLDNGIINNQGSLTTRTDDTAGIATTTEDHDMTTSDLVDVLWGSGHRYGMTVSATGATTVSFTGGAGDNLPVADAPIRVRKNDKIAARIARSITTSSSDVDSLMRGGLYTIPFQNTDDTDTPEDIMSITAVKAAVWLYERRGVEDYDAENETSKHRLAFQKEEADAKIREIRAGVRLMDAKGVGKTYPSAVDSYTEASERTNT